MNKPAEPSPEVAPTQKYPIREMAGFIKDYTGGRRLKDYLKEVAEEESCPAVAPQETQPEPQDRSMRVLPLADKALYLLMQEEDVEVRRAAVKLINIAEKHWLKEKRYGR